MYWTFNQPDRTADSMQYAKMDFAYYNCQYGVIDGIGGKAIDLSTASNATIGGSLVADSNIVIEFLFKPGQAFNQSQFFERYDGAISVAMSYPEINFNTKHTKFAGGTENDQFKIYLDGVSRKAFTYYTDGNWHHIVFKFNASQGKKEIWVDGLLANGFSKTIPPGVVSNSGNKDIYMSSLTSYYRYYGGIDEIAIYNKDLPNKLIYKHYLQFQQGLPYSFLNDYTQTIPTAPPVTGSIDLAEFAPGHPNVTVDFLNQLKSFPAPRYKRGHTLKENFQWMNPEYVAGRFQTGIDYDSAVANSLILQDELVKNFNYSILVSENTGFHTAYNDVKSFPGAWVNYANQNPQYKTSAICFWPQVNPQAGGFSSTSPYANCQTNPNNYYLKNSAGQFLNNVGNVSTVKYWSPVAPRDSVKNDGKTQKFLIEKLLTSLTRPLNNLNENGELLPYYTESVMTKDPAVVNDYNNSGYTDYFSYFGNRAYQFTNAYKSEFNSVLQQEGTYFSHYAVDGYNNYRAKYADMRNIQTTQNGQKYPTPDFYPRYPSYWKEVPGAWHGLQWILDCRINELAFGDNLYSPFVAAGWDVNEEINIRPAQWLGLLKILGATGAEYFYTGFFNEQGSYNYPNPPPAHPKNYIWQEVMPPLAQGITSRYEDFLRNGDLMVGDEPNKSTNNLPGYRFKTGDQSKIVSGRKLKNANKYVFAGAIEQLNNNKGSAPDESPVTINLNNQPLKFIIRRQGSVYFYDNTNVASPIFYQLDKWHENTHPYNWSKDFNIEAELYDNVSANAQIKTTLPIGAAVGDFTNYSTTVQYSNGSTPTALEYDINVRETQATYYVWVRMRSTTGINTGATIWLDNANAKNISCITSTDFHWYRIDSTTKAPISVANVVRGNHTIKIMPYNNAFEIDNIVLLKSSTTVLDNFTTTCSGAVTPASITPSGPTTFCTGNNVLLTANSGMAYLWSNGQNTQSITVTVAGTYTVTVTDFSGLQSNASQSVIVNPRPATPVTNSDYIIGTGYNLKAEQPNATSFLWSTGNTTNLIAVNSTGIYTVAASDGKCLSLPATINVASLSPKSCVAPDMLTAHDITTNSAIVSWNGAIAADSFVVLYYADFTNQLFYKTVSGLSNELRINNLTPTKGYKVTVIAKCGASSYYSARISFTTLSTSLPCVAIPHDLTVSNLTYNSVNLSWFSTVADSFEVRYKTSLSTNYVIKKVAGGLNSSLIISPLLSNKDYVWSVRSFCNGVASMYSFDKFFKTPSASGLCDSPIGVFVNAVTGSTAELMWDNSSNPDSVVIKYRIPAVTPYKYIKLSGNPNSGYAMIENLSLNTTYKVEVKYVCSGISSDYTTPLYFTTANSNGRMLNEEQSSSGILSPINIYPNPANSIVHYDINSNAESNVQVRISDALGHRMFSHEHTCTQGINSFEVFIEGWPSGIYVFEMINAGVVYKYKLNVY